MKLTHGENEAIQQVKTALICSSGGSLRELEKIMEDEREMRDGKCTVFLELETKNKDKSC